MLFLSLSLFCALCCFLWFIYIISYSYPTKQISPEFCNKLIKMKLLVFTLLLSTITSCASLKIKHQSSHNQVDLVRLPRKLKLIDESTLHARVLESDEELHSYSHQHGPLSGKHNKEAEIEHGKGVTWREHWFDSADKSRYFTMDYSHVRRRRPIHNRSINLSP